MRGSPLPVSMATVPRAMRSPRIAPATGAMPTPANRHARRHASRAPPCATTLSRPTGSTLAAMSENMSPSGPREAPGRTRQARGPMPYACGSAMDWAGKSIPTSRGSGAAGANRASSATTGSAPFAIASASERRRTSYPLACNTRYQMSPLGPTSGAATAPSTRVSARGTGCSGSRSSRLATPPCSLTTTRRPSGVHEGA